MLELAKMMIAFALLAIYMIAAGFYSYAWSEGNERIQRRFYGMFMAGLVLFIALGVLLDR